MNAPESLGRHFVSGTWIRSNGHVMRSVNPSDGSVVWQGDAATADIVHRAFLAARAAQDSWEAAGLESRSSLLRRYADVLEKQRRGLEEAISLEAGKPPSEARAEVQSMIGKVDLSLRAQTSRCSRVEAGKVATEFRPLGVCAVLGPFNFPGHLPNGHIVPALLAGNCVVFKPSERTPLVAERMLQVWQEVGLPAGVLNLVQGAAETGALVTAHPDLNGLFFTGSARVGLALHRQFAGRPEVLLALEMGGNNPLVCWPPFAAETAVPLILQSAFATAGQRCTCARRLILPRDARGDALLETLVAAARSLPVGPPQMIPEPFFGPVISERQARAVLEEQDRLEESGARILLRAAHLVPGTGLLSPGIADVTDVSVRQDEEIFGPILQVVRCVDYEAALQEAGRTRYGLSAGLVTEDDDAWEIFRRRLRAGVLHRNVPLTGASGAAAFGGAGLSGNHRPSAWLAADYCNRAVALQETRA